MTIISQNKLDYLLLGAWVNGVAQFGPVYCGGQTHE